MHPFIGTEKHSMDDPEAVQNDLEAPDKLTCGLRCRLLKCLLAKSETMTGFDRGFWRMTPAKEPK